MPESYDIGWRLEPSAVARSLTAGFSAAVHDPVWFLARQWQLGEHQGENATTPVLVSYQVSSEPVRPAPDDPAGDPTRVPAEALVESEVDSWWTVGRRVRVGAALGLVDVPAAYRLLDPPPPYERLVGAVDGLAAWRDPAPLGLSTADFAGFGIPAPRPFRWDPAELVYTAGFPVGDTTLELPRHRGGRVDWFSASAPAPVEPAALVDGHAYPVPLQYPGAPVSRWWEIEDAAVDIGGYPPDTSHLATALLIDLVSTHGDDWFLFPVDGQVGHVLTLPRVTVTDAFGDTYEVAPPADPWWLFRTTGLSPSSLVLWLRAVTPIEGQPVEDVLLGLDEYANLLWAVERRVAGHSVTVDAPTVDAPVATGSFAYAAGRDAPAHWHPYEIEDAPRRRFVQRRLADLSGPGLTPAPVAEVLLTGAEVHRIEPATVPSIGIVLERRHRLARDVDGNPVLWSQRQRTPFLRPPSRANRYDLLLET